MSNTTNTNNTTLSIPVEVLIAVSGIQGDMAYDVVDMLFGSLRDCDEKGFLLHTNLKRYQCGTKHQLSRPILNLGSVMITDIQMRDGNYVPHFIKSDSVDLYNERFNVAVQSIGDPDQRPEGSYWAVSVSVRSVYDLLVLWDRDLRLEDGSRVQERVSRDELIKTIRRIPR